MTKERLRRDPASFRDPSGYVVDDGERIFRIVSAEHAAVFAPVVASRILQQVAQRGLMIGSRVVSDSEIPQELISGLQNGEMVLAHERLEFISYPYEWPFEALRDAALAHLDLQIELLGHDLTLTDASAFNVQFKATAPVFIDVLSVVPYSDGQLWQGYAQFRNEFLNPLLIEAATGVSMARYYRGKLSGPDSRETISLLPLRWRLKPVVITHVALPARFEQKQEPNGKTGPAPTPRPLPRSRLLALLGHLRRSIAALPRPKGRNSLWQDYAGRNSYEDDETLRKVDVVRQWVSTRRPQRLIDLGCNTGKFTEIALREGVKHVIGVDSDRASLDICWQRAKEQGLAILPLEADLANPAPAQGWGGHERRSLLSRLHGDGVLALALFHHLVIGRNLPPDQVIAMIVGVAPCGLIEFVPKEDPMVQTMLTMRRDIFPDYRIECFRQLLSAHARIVGESAVTSTGRMIFEFERN